MFKKIFYFLKINPYRYHYNILLVSDSLIGATYIILESLLIMTIGDGLLDGNRERIITGVIIYVITKIIIIMLIIILSISFDKMKGKLKAFLRGEFLSKTFFVNAENQSKVDNSYYILTNDTDEISNFFENFHMAVGCITRIIASLVVGIFISWHLSVVVFALCVIKVIISKKIISKMEETVEGIVDMNSKMLSNILEVFESSSFFRFLNIKYPTTALNKLYKQYKPMYKKETTYTVRIETFNNFLDMISIVLVLSIGSLLSFYGYTSISAIAAFLIIQDTITHPVSFMGDFLKNFKYQMVSYDRYVNETDAKHDDNVENFDNSIDKINIEELCYSYTEANIPTLSNLSTVITSGHITYVIGESGVGKTTLFKLITGLLQPDNGKIEFTHNGLLVENPKITYTSQSPVFIKGSVAENITLSRDIDARKLEDAIQKSQLLDVFINNNNLENIIIDAKASNLSIGQKDRLALARAFYHESYINIYDEIFSSLDNVLISNILPVLDEISRKGKIVLIISHRQDWIPLDAVKIVI